MTSPSRRRVSARRHRCRSPNVAITDNEQLAAGQFPRRQRVLNLIHDDEPWLTGEAVERPDRHRGGRKPHFPPYMPYIFGGLIHECGSAMEVEREMHGPPDPRRHPGRVDQALPQGPGDVVPRPSRAPVALQLRQASPRRPDCIPDEALERLGEIHRRHAAGTAEFVGLCLERQRQSRTHPDLDCIVHGDGKDIKVRRIMRADLDTGEIITHGDADAEW